MLINSTNYELRGQREDRDWNRRILVVLVTPLAMRNAILCAALCPFHWEPFMDTFSDEWVNDECNLALVHKSLQ